MSSRSRAASPCRRAKERKRCHGCSSIESWPAFHQVRRRHRRSDHHLLAQGHQQDSAGSTDPAGLRRGVSMTLLEAEMCALIARKEGVTGSELSEELAVTRSATSQIISKLKARALSPNGLRNATPSESSFVDAARSRCRRHGGRFKAAMSMRCSAVRAEGVRAYLRFVTKLESFHAQAIKQAGPQSAS